MAQKRFIYSAGATAVGAVLTNPSVSRAWASVSLPSIGGVVKSDAAGPQIPSELAGILSFNTAVTEITGSMQNNQAVTDVVTTVTGLDVCGGRLKAAKVEMRMTFAFNAGNEKLEAVTGLPSAYTGLEIDGRPIGPLTLDFDFGGKAADHIVFRRNHLPGKKHHHRGHPAGPQKDLGRVHTTLVEQKLEEDLAKGEFAFITASFGRVHFAEWAQDVDWQSIVGLRIELDGKNCKGAEGTIVIADIDPNGEFYP